MLRPVYCAMSVRVEESQVIVISGTLHLAVSHIVVLRSCNLGYCPHSINVDLHSAMEFTSSFRILKSVVLPKLKMASHICKVDEAMISRKPRMQLPVAKNNSFLTLLCLAVFIKTALKVGCVFQN